MAPIRRYPLIILLVLLLELYAAAWAGSYAVALEYTFRPTPSRWCQVGINFGTVYFASEPWPANLRYATGRLKGYDARNEGVALAGLGVYLSWHGTTPGGDRNVFIVGVPLWFPLVAILAALWLRRVSARRTVRRLAQGLCLTCGYDLRASRDRCPECGTPVAPYPDGSDTNAQHHGQSEEDVEQAALH